MKKEAKPLLVNKRYEIVKKGKNVGYVIRYKQCALYSRARSYDWAPERGLLINVRPRGGAW